MDESASPAGIAAARQRCGLVAIVGRPNVGKSTLLNALVGQKISITSRKAQTTRHRITGIRTLGDSQFVFVDTPGFQTRHGGALNRTLNRTVQGVLADVDVVLFVVEAGRFGLDDAKVLALMPAGQAGDPGRQQARRGAAPRRARAVAQGHAGAPCLRRVRAAVGHARPPTSSGCSTSCEPYLPEQPWFYDEDALTDRSERFLASEIDPREAVPPDRRRAALHLDRRDRQVRGRGRPAPHRRHHRRRARRAQGHGHRRRRRAAEAHRHRGARRSSSSCWTPRSSSSSGSRCARAGPTTRSTCAATATSERPGRAASRRALGRRRRPATRWPPCARPPASAYVLHRYDWSESSLILDLFTREQGRVAVAAKGAKRPYSQLRSVLLPFQRLHVALGRRPPASEARRGPDAAQRRVGRRPAHRWPARRCSPASTSTSC